MKIVTVEQMVDMERRGAEVGAPPDFLMENAGLATANAAGDLLGSVEEKSVMVLVGPGNNGGDGLVAARHLHDWGARVHLFLVKRKTENDKNFALDMERNIPATDALAAENRATFSVALSSADLFMDALFGTGRVRPFEGILKEMMEAVAREKIDRPALKILAVDLPSGLDADTGAIDPAAIIPDLTITFACPKIGLFRFPGAARLGRLQVADIKIPEYLAEHINTELITGEQVLSLLPTHPPDANKGTFGKLMVVAGSKNYIGAAYLACEGAMRVGTGLVTLATPASLQPILAAKLTEVTYLPLEENEPGLISPGALAAIRGQIAGYDGLLIGCGLGQNPPTVEFIKEILPGLPAIPTVIDADALNILAGTEQWWQNLPEKVVLTPHPGEMSRLMKKSVREIQEDRLEAALTAARQWGRTVVLKGAFTVVASPEGKAGICGIANPGLASAGTGDVLAGAIAGFMAQGLPPFDAATCGVYIHAMAGEMVKAEIGDTGMIASDLLLALPVVIREIKEQAHDAIYKPERQDLGWI
ncbi:MAG: NAD(P)H-hydrate dehydratase [Dehalococcoidia bacterium]